MSENVSFLSSIPRADLQDIYICFKMNLRLDDMVVPLQGNFMYEVIFGLLCLILRFQISSTLCYIII